MASRKKKKSPMARAAKACKGKIKGKFRACVKKKIKSFSKKRRTMKKGAKRRRSRR